MENEDPKEEEAAGNEDKGQAGDPAEEKTDLSDLVNEFIDELPEDMQGLIPESLSPVEKIKLARGLIKTAAKKAATPEDGPGSKTPGRKKAVDYTGMSATELLNAGLK
jgi:hypothetical protein